MHVANIQAETDFSFSITDPVLNEIIQIVARDFKMSVSEMMITNRSHDIWKPRMAAMYFARLLTTTTLTELGQIFGGRSHTTVLRAFRRCREMMDSDERWSAQMDRLLAMLIERTLMPRIE